MGRHSHKNCSENQSTSLVAGGLSLPCGVIKAAGCGKKGIVLQRQVATDTMLNVAMNHGVTSALEMQPQEASCPQEM